MKHLILSAGGGFLIPFLLLCLMRAGESLGLLWLERIGYVGRWILFIGPLQVFDALFPSADCKFSILPIKATLLLLSLHFIVWSLASYGILRWLDIDSKWQSPLMELELK